MTISLTGLSVDTGVPAQNPRAPSNPVISTAGNDQQAIARQQLPTAVPAPALLAAYSTGIAQQPKPPAKPFGSSPSSSFAAQFIAQEGGTAEDLALFTPPPLPAQTSEPEPAANDYLNDLRIARGDLGSAKTAPTQASEQADIRETVANAKAATTALGETTTRSSIGQFAASLPTLFSQLIRRPTLTQAKGVSAYQLAEARNAATRNAAPELATN